MKAVMLSLRPQWCEKIFNGSKTIEVRKSRPSIPTPFKVYVYQTKHKGKSIVSEALNTVYGGGTVIGSFVCDKVYKIVPDGEYYSNGYDIDDDMLIEMCLGRRYLTGYGLGYTIYGWHITGAKLYDKPKELSEFYTLGNCEKYDFCNQCKNFHRGQGWLDGSYCDEDSCLDNTRIPVTRAPQSWCYVEELL